MSEITKERTHTLRTEPFARLFFYRKKEDFQAILYLFILVNLNADQAADLQWNEIDFETKKLTVHGKTFILTPDICAFFTEFRARKLAEFFEKGILDRFRYVCCDEKGNKFTEEEISSAFQSYLKSLGIEPFTPDEVRMTFPEYLYENDMVTKVIRMYLENSRIK